MHPREVYQEVKRQQKYSLSPSLNFQAVEVGAGGLEAGIEYSELQPLISASGIGEYEFITWDYEEPRGIRLQGAKVMHLVVKAPKGMSTGEATIDLSADVNTLGILSAVLIRRQEATPLQVRLWG